MTKTQDATAGVSFTVTLDDEGATIQPENWEPSEHRLSPSKINLLLRCPRAFYYKYIEKLPDKLTLHLFRGTVVHNILQDIFTKEFKSPHKWRNGEPQEWAVLEFRKKWKELHETKEWLFKDPNIDGDVMERETIELLINFCHKIEKKLNELIDWGVAKSPYHALHQLKPHFAEQRIHNEEFKTMGIIDSVVKDFEDNISIVDYKTSKRYGHWVPEDYYRQLIIYALLYYKDTGVMPMFAGIDWLRYDESYFVRITQSEIDEAQNLIRGVHDDLENRGTDIENYELVPQKLCEWCAFYHKPCQPEEAMEAKK